MRDGPPVWGLGEVLTNTIRKKTYVKNYLCRDASSGDKTIRR
jgi:hypothetical protein